jgi:cytochrome c-type protein NapC
MPSMEWLFLTFVLVAVGLVAFIALRPGVTSGRGGRILSFFALFLLPLALTAGGIAAHLDHATSTEFCVSCHIMEPYGKSLLVDDSEWVPANHYQNRRIDRAHACYSCHTDYTLFGDLSAKLRGAKHVWVNYLGDRPESGEIELYSPYNNRECLHCHAGARSFAENPMHSDMLAELTAGDVSCLDCHSEMHNVLELDEQTLWEDADTATPGEEVKP